MNRFIHSVAGRVLVRIGVCIALAMIAYASGFSL